MASLTLTIDDTRIARVQAAYGATTNAQLKTAIIADIRNKVISYEAGVAGTTEYAKIQTARNDADTAIAAATTKATTEITVT